MTYRALGWQDMVASISMASMLSVVPMTDSTYTSTDEMDVLYAAMWQI